jgi:hypothetical protein
MSGYNKKTGLFELTGSQAAYWLRRNDIPEECSASGSGLRLAKCLLEHYGIRVVADHVSWLEVDATQAQIWEVLSGQPSDPRRAACHNKDRPKNTPPSQASSC